MTRHLMKTKWSRLKTIFDNLYAPKTIEEIENLLSKNNLQSERRTIYNDLEELKALGLIEHNESVKTFQRTEVKRVVYASKVDYEAAVNHAQFLLLSSEKLNTQRYDQMWGNAILNILAYPRKYDLIFNDCFLQHLQTGYNEIYQYIQEFRELTKETGPLPLELGTVSLPKSQETKESNQRVSNEKDKKIDDLRALILGKINFILEDVMEGQPLLGQCNQCPHLKFTVKD